MKTYLTSQGYKGTQAEATAIDGKSPFVIVEIPTDKDGLLGFINGLWELYQVPLRLTH